MLGRATHKAKVLRQESASCCPGVTIGPVCLGCGEQGLQCAKVDQ